MTQEQDETFLQVCYQLDLSQNDKTRPTTEEKLMKCPYCGLFNPPSADRCDCGHSFKPDVPSRISTDAPKQQLPTNLIYGAVIGLVVGIAVIIVGNIGSTTAKVPEIPKREASLEFACRDFNRMIEDFDLGVLTADETRERAKEIRKNLRLSPTPGARQAGDHLVRSMTGSYESMADALKEIRLLCK